MGSVWNERLISVKSAVKKITRLDDAEYFPRNLTSGLRPGTSRRPKTNGYFPNRSSSSAPGTSRCEKTNCFFQKNSSNSEPGTSRSPKTRGDFGRRPPRSAAFTSSAPEKSAENAVRHVAVPPLQSGFQGSSAKKSSLEWAPCLWPFAFSLRCASVVSFHSALHSATVIPHSSFWFRHSFTLAIPTPRRLNRGFRLRKSRHGTTSILQARLWGTLIGAGIGNPPLN